jgi:hypothetical protein
MEKIDSRTLPVDALNGRRRRAVKMRLEGTSLMVTAGQCAMSHLLARQQSTARSGVAA